MVKDKTQGIEVIRTKVRPVIDQADKIVIGSAEDMKGAVELLSTLNRWNDEVVEDREKITKPLNATLKEIRERYKPIEEVLKDRIAVLRRKITDYQTKATRIADEEANKIANRVKEGKGNLKMETAVKKMDAIEKPEEKVMTEVGAVKFQAMKKFEVVDVTLLPAHLLLPNEVEIRRLMKTGVEVTGVRYYVEQVPINSR